MFFIGIGVHKKQSQICILDECGDILHELRVPTDLPNLTDVLGPFVPGRVLVEACTPSEWLARHLEGLGFSVVVADPNFAPMYATRQKKVKTDKCDARALAQALKLGAYKPARRLSDCSARLGRRWMSGRAWWRRAPSCSTGSARCFRTRDIVSPRAAPRPSRDGWRAWERPPQLRTTLEPLLTLLEPLNEQIAAPEASLEAAAEADVQTRLLRTVPGVGPLTALMFAAVIDGAYRFANVRQVDSYLGLVPREQSSGERQCRDRITQAGAPRMRTLLAQAAAYPAPPEAGAFAAVAMGQWDCPATGQGHRGGGAGMTAGRSAVGDAAGRNALSAARMAIWLPQRTGRVVTSPTLQAQTV